MSDTATRSQFVADQTNARSVAALDAVIAALRGDDRDAIEAAVIEFGKASWEAGWDQAHADIRAIVKDNTGLDIGAGEL